MSGEEKPVDAQDELEESAGEVGEGGESGEDKYKRPVELLNQALVLRLRDGFSIPQIAQKLNVSKALIGRLLKGIQVPQVSEKVPAPSSNPGPSPNGERSAADRSESPLNIPEEPFAPRNQPQPRSPQAQMPDAPNVPGVFLSPQAMLNLRSMLTPAQQRLYDATVNLASLEQQRVNQPSPYAYYPNVGSELDHELAEDLKYDRVERHRNRMRGNDGSNDKRTDFLEKLVVESLLKGKENAGFGIGDFVKLQMESQKNSWDFLQRQMEVINSLKPDQMSDEVRLAIAKMGQEMEFRKMENTKEVEKWSALTQVFAPVGAAAPALVSSLLGGKSQQVQNPAVTNLQCSSCGHVWPVTTKPRGPIKCPQCQQPVSMEVFSEPQLSVFKCGKCGVELSIPAGKVQELFEKGVESVPYKCPKCGFEDVLKQQSAETPSPTTTAPSETPKEETSVGRLRPTYS